MYYYVILTIFYSLFIIFPVLFIYLVIFFNSKRSYYLKKRYNWLLFITLIAIILGPFEIIINSNIYNLDKMKIIEFNLHYIIGIPSLIMYIYRGLINYLYLKNKSFRKYIKNICFYIYIFILIYTFIIDIYLYINNMVFDDIYFYLYYLVCLIFVLIHPLIIYLLFSINSDIKYDYIFTMIINFITLASCIIYEIIKINEFKNNNFLNVLIKISKFKITITSVLSYIFFLLIPLIYFYRQKNPIKNIIYRKDGNVINNNCKNELNIKFLNNYDKINKNDKKEIYDFYKKNIIEMKNNDLYLNEIDKIEEYIKNLKYNDCLIVYEKLYNEVKDDILIETYKDLI